MVKWSCHYLLEGSSTHHSTTNAGHIYCKSSPLNNSSRDKSRAMKHPVKSVLGLGILSFYESKFYSSKYKIMSSKPLRVLTANRPRGSKIWEAFELPGNVQEGQEDGLEDLRSHLHITGWFTYQGSPTLPEVPSLTPSLIRPLLRQLRSLQKGFAQYTWEFASHNLTKWDQKNSISLLYSSSCSPQKQAHRKHLTTEIPEKWFLESLDSNGWRRE